MVYILSNTTINIDVAGTGETRTIMRAELVTIHTALTTFASHEWIGIFTDSLSSLQTIRCHYTNPGAGRSMHYLHHMLLFGSIINLLETIRSAGFVRTTLHNIRAHTITRGKDLVDAAAKLAVTHFDTPTPSQTMRVNIGGIAPRPTHWVMYTANPPPTDPDLSTCSNRSTLRRPWWTVPDANRLQMHAFTRPSLHLRLKVRDALPHSLHQSSLFKRLIIANKEKGARSKIVGQTLHKRLTYNSMEGNTLLKLLYGQLYNGKLSKRYGHALTSECPVCHIPTLCSHIAGECSNHEDLRISRHNATCQLVQAAIRKTAKGGGAFDSAPDIVMAMADTGT